MAFSEAVKLAVNRKAHFRCCICQRPSVSLEAHHIVPQADGGSDDQDNAAPLCPTCHEEYGANPEKRTAIRVQRDFWYEICKRRYAADPDKLDEIIRSTQAIKSLVETLMGTQSESDYTVRDVQEIAEALKDYLYFTITHVLAKLPLELASNNEGDRDSHMTCLEQRYGEGASEPLDRVQLNILVERLAVLSWVLNSPGVTLPLVPVRWAIHDSFEGLKEEIFSNEVDGPGED
ncbi:MAG: HNH endonuclease [Thermomicrobiales bacterium]